MIIEINKRSKKKKYLLLILLIPIVIVTLFIINMFNQVTIDVRYNSDGYYYIENSYRWFLKTTNSHKENIDYINENIKTNMLKFKEEHQGNFKTAYKDLNDEKVLIISYDIDKVTSESSQIKIDYSNLKDKTPLITVTE
ncbi:MAG: hypothetical protein RSE93_02930 [Oscillospiraceae bacterium]